MRITLLLGAGASAFVGIPTTAGLVEDLRKRVKFVNDQLERPTARFFASNVLDETDPEDVEDLYDSVDRMLEAEETHRLVTKCKTKGQIGTKRQLVTVGSHSEISMRSSLEPPIDETDDIDNTIMALKSIKLAIRDMLLEKCMVDPKKSDDIKIAYDGVLKPLGICDVLTTNYDNVIETYCEDARIPLVNGFERSFHGDRREWTGKFGKAGHDALRLVKMHGSVTWQRDVDAVLELGRPGVRGEEYDIMIYPEKRPKRYDKSIFPDLRRKFREVLVNTDLLLVIGYSFRDRGINYMIKRRLAARAQKDKMRLLYVDPKPDSGMKNLMEKKVYSRPVQISNSTLLDYYAGRMPYLYAYKAEFDQGTSNRVKSAVDAVAKISR